MPWRRWLRLTLPALAGQSQSPGAGLPNRCLRGLSAPLLSKPRTDSPPGCCHPWPSPPPASLSRLDGDSVSSRGSYPTDSPTEQPVEMKAEHRPQPWGGSYPLIIKLTLLLRASPQTSSSSTWGLRKRDLKRVQHGLPSSWNLTAQISLI